MPLDNIRNSIFGGGNVQQFQVTKPQVTERDFYVHPKNREDMESIVKGIQNADRFGEMGYAGILLLGPPGTGKTLGVQYVAYKTGSKFIDAGTVADPGQVRALYDFARAEVQRDPSSKVLVFFDEIDKFSSRDNIIDPTQSSTLNQLLMQLDGTKANHYIFTFGATNKPDNLDNALRRGKRFGKEIEFFPPDEMGRYEILKIHADRERKKHQFEVKEDDLKELAKITYGYTGADLSAILTEAFAYANLSDRTRIEFGDLAYAVGKIKPAAIRDMPFVEPTHKLEDIAGYDSHKEVLRRIVGSQDSSKVLIYGPDGNGKTSMAEALAGSYGYNLVIVSASTPLEGIVGETEKKIGRYLDRAKQLAPCVLVFDKVDSLIEPRHVSSWRSSWTGILEARLSRKLDGVHVIATVTDPTKLRPTFLQIFGNRLYVPKPSEADQEKIWAYYLSKEGIKDVDPAELVKSNPRLCCVDFGQIMNQIKIFSLPKTQETLTTLTKRKVIDGEEGTDWEKIVREVGDCAHDYEQAKDLIGVEKK